MCGITGWVSFAGDLRVEQATVDAMTETMSRRGPDDRGTWFAEHAALGHRRLAIIDLPGGRQPMSVDTPGGAVAIVYSGEAYNFTELRAELIRRGHRFTTDSDTEVVLHAYLEWGDALAERLNGMYAFAIWDSREDKLVMVRDRMLRQRQQHPGSRSRQGAGPAALHPGRLRHVGGQDRPAGRSRRRPSRWPGYRQPGWSPANPTRPTAAPPAS